MFDFVWPFIFGIIFTSIMYNIEAHRDAVVQLIIVPLIVVLLGLKALIYFWVGMTWWMCTLAIIGLVVFVLFWLFVYTFACYGTH